MAQQSSPRDHTWVRRLTWRTTSTLVFVAALLAIPFSAFAATGTQIMTGLTAVGGQAWLPGDLSEPGATSSNNLWVADQVQGVCKVALDAGVRVLTTCNTDAASPGQLTFIPGAVTEHFLFVPDGASASTTVVRLTYDQTTETTGSPLVIDMAPGQTDWRPAATALGPDGKVYVGFRNNSAILRIADATTTPTVEAVGVSASGGGVKNLAFAGNDLYIAEAASVSKIVAAAACSGACAAAVEAGITVPGPRSLAADATHLYIGDTLGVHRYALPGGPQELFGDTGVSLNAIVVKVPLINVTSLVIDGATFYLADDPTGGDFQARIWTMPTGVLAGGDPLTPLSVATIYADQPGAGVTTPSNLLWMGDAATGRLWATDALLGLCRLDPVGGGATHAINLATCRASLGGRPVMQSDFDPVGNFVYVPVLREAIYRAPFIAATGTVGAFTTLVTDSDDTRVSSVALGPDGNLYAGYLRMGDIKRYVNPSGNLGGPPPTFFTVASAGLGVESLAFVGNDLYVINVVDALGAINLSVIPNAVACAGGCVSTPVPSVTLAAGDMHVFLASDGTSLFISNGTQLLRYDPATGAVDRVAGSGLDTLGNDAAFRALFGIGFDLQGNIFASDDTTAAGTANATRIWRIERPVVDAGPDQTVTVDTLVTLDGTGSSDPGSHLPLSFQWTQLAGPAVTLTGGGAAQPTFTAPATPAVLTFALRVVDGIGMVSKRDTVQVTVNDAPIAGLTLAGDSPTTLGQVTPFTATTTTGTNITYAWNFGDGSPVVAGGAANSHIYGATGLYTAIVTATNSATGNVPASVQINVTNQAPLANAGPDQNVLVGANVTLNGAGSSDPDGHTPLSYVWTQIVGPAVSLSNAAGAQPTFTAPGAPATLTFSLTIIDQRGLVSVGADTVTITVGDTAVTNIALISNSPTVLGQATTLTAEANGSNVVFTWDLGDGGTANGATVNHTYAAPGVYTVQVTAANGADSKSMARTVTVTNQKPVVNTGGNQSVQINEQVVLDASASFDPDGHTPLSFLWQQTGGAPVTLSDPAAPSPIFTTPGSAGALIFAVTVTDTRGLANTGQTIVNAGDVPISGLSIVTNSPVVFGTEMTLIANAVGSNITYAWTLGDGSPSVTGALVKHTYAALGAYTVNVVATNNLGVATKSVVVEVVNPAPIITGATIDPPPIFGQTGYTLTVVGSGFVPGSTVYWNDAPRPTTLVNDTEVHAAIAPDDVGAATNETVAALIVSVRVVNPAPGGGSSDPRALNVPAPRAPVDGSSDKKMFYLPALSR